MICVTDWVESIVGKEENAGNQRFLLFPPCFSVLLDNLSSPAFFNVKCSFFEFERVQNLLPGKGLTLYQTTKFETSLI